MDTDYLECDSIQCIPVTKDRVRWRVTLRVEINIRVT